MSRGPAPDPRDEVLAAMFAAWRTDIDAEPMRDMVAAALADEQPTARLMS